MIEATTAIHPSLVKSTLSVLSYEFRRSLTPIRIGVWAGMAIFPATLIITVSMMVQRRQLDAADIRDGFSILLFLVLPEVSTVLGMLLWATSIVSSELESQTWVYSVIRPGARTAMLLGKYAMAVIWTSSTTCVATTIAIPFIGMTQPLNTWATICTLCIVSAVAHGALFAFIGTVFQRRAMVTAFGYALIAEGVLAWIPATVNQFTVGYRLRSILAQWMDLDLERFDRFRRIVSFDTSVSMHLAVLAIGATCLLALTAWRLHASRFTWQSEF